MAWTQDFVPLCPGTRLASLQALLSASIALYHRRPRFRLISRDMVDGDLFNFRAIARILIFADRPALISSRSSMVRWWAARFLSSGFIPPDSRRIVNIEPGLASRTRAISLNPVPCFHNSNTRLWFQSVAATQASTDILYIRTRVITQM